MVMNDVRGLSGKDAAWVYKGIENRRDNGNWDKRKHLPRSAKSTTFIQHCYLVGERDMLKIPILFFKGMATNTNKRPRLQYWKCLLGNFLLRMILIKTLNFLEKKAQEEKGRLKTRNPDTRDYNSHTFHETHPTHHHQRPIS